MELCGPTCSYKHVPCPLQCPLFGSDLFKGTENLYATSSAQVWKLGSEEDKPPRILLSFASMRKNLKGVLKCAACSLNTYAGSSLCYLQSLLLHAPQTKQNCKRKQISFLSLILCKVSTHPTDLSTAEH